MNNSQIIPLLVPSNISKFWIHYDSISNQTKVANDSSNGWTTWQLVLEEGAHVLNYKIIGLLDSTQVEIPSDKKLLLIKKKIKITNDK